MLRKDLHIITINTTIINNLCLKHAYLTLEVFTVLTENFFLLKTTTQRFQLAS